MNYLKLILSMVIFGSIGLVVAYIPLPSVMIVGLRALLGTVCIGLLLIFRRKPINKVAVKKNIGWLLVSGVALAANWILLFESYDHTGSVAISTLCYYMAPVFVTILSPIFLKERLSAARIVCTAVAVAGAVMISGASMKEPLVLKGILMALSAAVLYALIVIFNKKMTRMPAQETTFFQLIVAAVVTLPYAFVMHGGTVTFSASWLIPMLILGVVHTGIAYLLFFGAANRLPAQSTAVLSYIDPVTAILLSTVVLQQPMDAYDIAGCAMILIAALLGELIAAKKRHR